MIKIAIPLKDYSGEPVDCVIYFECITENIEDSDPPEKGGPSRCQYSRYVEIRRVVDLAGNVITGQVDLEGVDEYLYDLLWGSVRS